MNLEAALLDVSKRLTRLGIGHALVGGLAISIRAEVRFTRDVDLAISVRDDAEVEGLTRALVSERFVVAAIVEQDDAKRIAIARLRSPAGLIIDLLAASSGVENEIVATASVTESLIGIPVATREHLLAMKVLSMTEARLQDRIDAQALLASGELDLLEVRRVLGLIETRGYARGQDLGAKLDSLVGRP